MENNKFLEILQKVKTERKWNNKEFAAKLDCSPSYLSMVMNGKKGIGADLIYSLQKIITGEVFTPTSSVGTTGTSSPYITKIVAMLEGMDEDTQKDICLSVEKEQLLREMLRDRAEREAA